MNTALHLFYRDLQIQIITEGFCLTGATYRDSVMYISIVICCHGIRDWGKNIQGDLTVLHPLMCLYTSGVKIFSESI